MVNQRQLLMLCFFLAACVVLYGGPYSGGSGTALSPYLIKTASDWKQLAATQSDWDKSYRLAGHIDLAGVLLTPIGNTQTRFTGTFDGNGYTVRNAVIDLPNQMNVGLFGYVGSRGHLHNLGMINAFVRGKGAVGALAGFNHGVIVSCYASGTVSGTEWDVGGLIGRSVGGAIDSSYAACIVNSMSNYVGGLVGSSYNDEIFDSYAGGTVLGNAFVGGLVGLNEMGYLSNCYATAATSGRADVGGLVGYIYDSYILCSFWDTEATGQFGSAGGQGKTTNQMQTLSVFLDAGWDFEIIWWMPDNSYPRLRDTSFLTDPLPGDLNRDGVINWNDMILFAREWLRDDCSSPGWCSGADITRSGRVRTEDLVELTANWLTRYAASPFGDLDKNGFVNSADFALFSRQWLRDNCAEPDWCEGADIDYSGSVDGDDLLMLMESWLK